MHGSGWLSLVRTMFIELPFLRRGSAFVPWGLSNPLATYARQRFQVTAVTRHPSDESRPRPTCPPFVRDVNRINQLPMG